MKKMIKMSGYPAEYWEKNRCQSIHITVGYHRFPPTQHILKHNWINESKMRKRPQEATATPHIFFSSLLPSLPQEEKLFSDASTRVSWQENFAPRNVLLDTSPGYLQLSQRKEAKISSHFNAPPLPHFSSVLHHVYVILQDHLSTIHISTFWFHKW